MPVVDNKVERTVKRDAAGREIVREVESPVVEREPASNVAARVVWFVTGVILTLLGVRFIFALLGANPANGLADFVYDVTYPLVAPFFNLFSYDAADTGVGRFEFFTLIAMLVYGLIGWGITRLMLLARR